jgi:Outer membrane protein beta-barrel domain
MTMKKLILTVVAAMAMAMSSNAQDSGLQFGVKAGGNFSNVYDSQGETFNADGKLGFAAGVFLGIPLGELLGVQPEILFSQKGFKATGKVLGSAYSLTRTTNYIDVPLFLAIKPIPALTILVGPQYSYLLKQDDVFANSILNVEQTKEFNNDNIRKNVLSIAGGLDINLKNLVIGARAGWDFQNNNGDGTKTTPRYKNAWVQATLGLRIY